MKKSNGDLEAVGKRIRSVRDGQDLTREQVAEIAGISAETIKRAENGQSIMMDSFLPLVKALNTSADYLCFGDNSISLNTWLIKNTSPFDWLLVLLQKDDRPELQEILRLLKSLNDPKL